MGAAMFVLNGSSLTEQTSCPKNIKTAAAAAAIGSIVRSLKKKRLRKRKQRVPKPSGVMTGALVAAGRKGSGSGSARMSGNPYAPNGRLTIKHREYIGEYIGPQTAFSAFTYTAGPALRIDGNAVFPWLCNVATNFDCYHFKSLKFALETEVATTFGGSIMMAFDVDCQDSEPATKQQMMVFPNAVRAPPWQSLELSVAKHVLDMFDKRRYVCTKVNPPGDLKTFFVGNLFVASQGLTAILNAELYVEYEIELMDPVAASINTESLGPLAVQIGDASVARYSSGGVVSKADVFGTVPISAFYPLLERPVIASVSTNALTFHLQGTFLLYVYAIGTALISPTLGGTAGRAGGALLLNAASTNGSTIILVTVSAVDQTLTFDFSASATLTSLDVRAAVYAPGLN